MFSSYGFSSKSSRLSPVPFRDIVNGLKELEAIPGIKVELFGSIAREGLGNDVDLILTSTESHWRAFREAVLSRVKEETTAKVLGAFHRWDVVGDVLGREVDTLLILLFEPVDVYVFPRDWKNRLDELQSAFPHEDPNFMRNIAKDAKPLAELAQKYL